MIVVQTDVKYKHKTKQPTGTVGGGVCLLEKTSESKQMMVKYCWR